MRPPAFIFLIIGSLFTVQVHAEAANTQPLTRADCDKAEMVWDENANVRGSPPAEGPAEPETPVGLS